MNKEEILEKSRKENNNKDLAEIEVLKQASKIAYTAGCLICMAICAVQWVVTNTINWGCWVANFGMIGTIFLVKAIKLRKKHEILTAIGYYAICLFFLIGFIMSMRG